MKKDEKIKLLIISSLVVLFMILLFFYVSKDDDDANLSSDTSNQNISRPSGDKFARDFARDIDSIISSFGIKKEWMKETAAKDKDLKNKPGQLIISKEIFIPPDVQTIDLNFEISDYLRKINYDARVTEDPKSKNILMNIFTGNDSSGKQIGSLKFVYLDSLKRNAASVCIVLDSLDYNDLADVEKIISSTEDFSVMLPLRNDKADYQSLIIDKKRNFLVEFLVGTGDDIESDFNDDMKESAWKSKVRTVAINFPQAAGIILSVKDGTDEFANEVSNEFTKNNLKVYKDTLFTKYKTGVDKVGLLLDDIITKSKGGAKFLFYNVNLNPGEFSDYIREINTLKKLGYKFLDFSDMMKKINKPG